MRAFHIVLAVLCLLITTAAQEPTPPAVTASPAATPAESPSAAAPKPSTVTLREGTPVQLKFAQALNSKTAAEEDPVNFLVAEDVVVDGVVIAKAGTFAAGAVSHAKRAGMLGKGGELNIRLTHMKCADQRIRLRGSKGKEGEGKEGTAVALTVLFGPIGLIKHGKNVEVKEGTLLTAYVDEDYVLPSGGSKTE
jgi:hypothetical protein